MKEGYYEFKEIVDCLKLKFLYNINESPQKPSLKEIELDVLSSFDWKVNVPTIFSFLQSFITEIKMEVSKNNSNKVIGNGNNDPVSLLTKEMIVHAEYLAELVLQRPKLLYSVMPSCIAAACIFGSFHLCMAANWAATKQHFEPSVVDIGSLSSYILLAITRVATAFNYWDNDSQKNLIWAVVEYVHFLRSILNFVNKLCHIFSKCTLGQPGSRQITFLRCSTSPPVLHILHSMAEHTIYSS